VPRAHINGVDLAYETHGSGQPLLFIHGGYGGAATAVVPPLLPEVVAIFEGEPVQVITYDRRGAGLSEFDAKHYTNHDLANDALGLLDHLEVDRTIVVGSSAGGPIALTLALAHPERVLALALPNTGAYLMRLERPRSAGIKKLVDLAAGEGDRAAFESRRDSLRTSPDLGPGAAQRPEAQARLDAVREALRTLPDEELFRLSVGEVRNYEAAFTPDNRSRLGELRMPVCVLHGTEDNTVPFEWGRALHEGIPGSEFHAIEGADHGLLNYPEAAAALRDWVRRQLAVAAR
jgi:pimeloyl-ACP methyl ester carboxylesterase